LSNSTRVNPYGFRDETIRRRPLETAGVFFVRYVALGKVAIILPNGIFDASGLVHGSSALISIPRTAQTFKMLDAGTHLFGIMLPDPFKQSLKQHHAGG
jgi:hypothetical protein